MKLKSIIRLVGCIILCEAAGILGSFFTFAAIPAWYTTLQKPFLNPPSWIFGPVWTTLYALMGIALFLIWQKKNKTNTTKIHIAINIFFMQLILNATWSIIFFGLHSTGFALINIIMLWLLIVETMAQFTKIRPTAAWLLLPYIIWVSFATYLNTALWFLNQ